MVSYCDKTLINSDSCAWITYGHVVKKPMLIKLETVHLTLECLNPDSDKPCKVAIEYTDNSSYPAKNSDALPTPSLKPKPIPNATAIKT